MANQVVSQMKKEEEELEALKKAYEDKKKELANKKRAYTKLVNQTEDMKKELESLYESLDKGPYKKTARFDSTVYDRIAELEEAIRENDEKLGREKFTYTETTTTTTRTVTVEGEPVARTSDVIYLPDKSREDLEVKLAILHQFETNLKQINERVAEGKLDDKAKLNFSVLYNVMNAARREVIAELGSKYLEVDNLIKQNPNVDAKQLRELLGVDALNIKGLDEEERKEVVTQMSDYLIKGNEKLHSDWEDKRDARHDTIDVAREANTRETIGKVQALIHDQVRKEFQYIGLSPMMYAETEEEIEKDTLPLTDEQKALQTVAKEALEATIAKTADNATYENVRDEYVHQIDLERDTFKTETYKKVQEVKEKMDRAIKDLDDDASLRAKFKQKRAERKLAHELGIPRKDLRLYQKGIDKIYEQYNSKDNKVYRTLDLNTLVLVNNILKIDDESIDRYEQLEEIYQRASYLTQCEKDVDSMRTSDHLEEFAEKYSDIRVMSVEAKNDDYDWSMIDTTKLDYKDLERLESLGLEVHDELQEIYDEYNSKQKEFDAQDEVADVKCDKVNELVDENTSDLIEFFEKKFAVELTSEEDKDEDKDKDKDQDAGAEAGAEADDDEDLDK